MSIKINLNFFIFTFFFFFIALIIGNATVNLSILFFSILVLRNLKKISINSEILILALFFFTITFSSIIKNHDFSDLSLLRFFLISLFSYIYFNEISLEIKKIFNFLILIIFFVSIDIILIEFANTNIFFQTNYTLSTDKTIGLFGTEQISGSYLSKILILIVGYLFFQKKQIKLKIANIVYGLIVLAGIISIIITDERRAILEIIVALIILNLIFFNKKKFFLSFLILVIMGAFIFVNPNLKEKIIYKSLSQLGLNQNFTDSEKTLRSFQFGILYEKNSITSNQYYAMYKTSYNIWLDNKIFGGGNKSYRKLCNNPKFQYDDYYSKIRCNTHPHSIYLQVLAEFGIVGLTLFMFLISLIIVKSFLYMNNSIILSSLVLLLCLLVPLPSGNIFSTWIGSIFWLNFGILLNASKSKNKREIK